MRGARLEVAAAYAANPLDFRYTGHPFDVGSRLHLSVRDQCVAFDTIARWSVRHRCAQSLRARSSRAEA